MNSKLNILIIENHQLFADGIALILDGLGSNVAVTICKVADEPFQDIERLKEYQLILVSLNMPNFSGFGFLRAAYNQDLKLPIAVLSNRGRRAELELAISLGAKAFILKDTTSKELVRAAKLILDGKLFFPALWDRQTDWARGNRSEIANQSRAVTNRQMQVLELMRHGLQNKEIASTLGISAYSVKDHVKGLFQHFQVHNRTSCVQVARDQNVI